jgi:hypothetical protein
MSVLQNDWVGNKGSIYKTLGASNHTDKERETNDFYATDPIAIDVLCGVEKFSKNVWECACGQGHLSRRLEQHGYTVKSTDLVDRGYGEGDVDFLQEKGVFEGDIITNPPYKVAREFIEKGLEIVPVGNKVAMFLKVQFLEGKARKQLFYANPPKVVYVSSSRLLCAKNAEFEKMIEGGGSAVAYAWFIWYKGFQGETVLKWVN